MIQLCLHLHPYMFLQPLGSSTGCGSMLIKILTARNSMLRDCDEDLRGIPGPDDARTAVIALLYVGSRLGAAKDFMTNSKGWYYCQLFDLIQVSAQSQVLN
jgi:hypothetical protein